MFDNLTSRLSKAVRTVSGTARITNENIDETLREIRKALLEADVALPVIKDLMESVKTKALGQEVPAGLTPGQHFLKIVQSELTDLIGGENVSLNLAARPPVVLLIAGLQGAGKTSTAAKLARFLMIEKKKKVMLVSTDIYRPAAIRQLHILSDEVGALFSESTQDQNPVDIVKIAMDAASKQCSDILLIDTAGRLHVDQALMDELKAIHAISNPAEVLFVIDAMLGQDAVNVAKVFADTLPLTGVILTKIDGDTRGGAALSVRHVTGQPIKFLCSGEKTDALEQFHPERLVSRILGMGDVLSLIEEAERKIDRTKAERMIQKIQKGKAFDFDDLRDQLQQMKNMGGLGQILEKMPGLDSQMLSRVDNQDSRRQLVRMEAIINSMTASERRRPDLVMNIGSRKKRITAGSGTSLQELNRLCKQYKQMSKMMKKMKNPKGMMNMLRGLESNMGQGATSGPHTFTPTRLR